MKWSKYAPFVISILLVLIITSPALLNLDKIGREDWDQHCFFDEVPRQTIFEYGQLPFWNPYASGGRPVLGNPQYNFLRPTYVFTMIFGCIVGLKLETIFLLIVGVIGMVMLARYYQVGILPSILMAMLFGLSSYFTMRIVAGHTTFFPLVFAPFAVLYYLKSLEKTKYLFFSAIFFGLMILGGAVIYAFVPLGIFLGVYGTTVSLQKKEIKPILVIISILLLAVCFTAFKSLPMIEYLGENQRITDTSKEIITFRGISHIFLNAYPEMYIKHFPEQVWGWHEYSNYTGPLPIIFLLISLFFLVRKQLPLFLAGTAMFLISIGDFAYWSPWSLLHSLPFIESVRVPSRFMILFIFALAIVSGLCLDRLIKKSKKKSIWRTTIIVLVAITFLDIGIAGYNITNTAFENEQLEINPNESFSQITDENPKRSKAISSMYWNLKENKGTLNDFDPTPHKTYAVGANNENYKGEIFVEGNGTAKYSFWSPNKLIAEVKVSSTSLLIINQNYDSGWRINDGRKTINYDGLLATRVTPADKIVIFEYYEDLFLFGILISVITLLGAVHFINK